MYICDRSRSLGAGSATTRKTRGLTRSVRALIVPPLPAPSRPSKTMQTFAPVCCTHSCSLTSSTCSFLSALAYSLVDMSSPGVATEAGRVEVVLDAGADAPRAAGAALLLVRTFMIVRSPSNGRMAGGASKCLDELGHGLEQVGNEPVVGNREDRRLFVVVDRD